MDARGGVPRMYVEEDAQQSIEKGSLAVSSLRNKIPKADLVRRASDMEEELGQGTIGSDLVEEHEFRSSPKSLQPS